MGSHLQEGLAGAAEADHAAAAASGRGKGQHQASGLSRNSWWRRQTPDTAFRTGRLANARKSGRTAASVTASCADASWDAFMVCQASVQHVAHVRPAHRHTAALLPGH